MRNYTLVTVALAILLVGCMVALSHADGTPATEKTWGIPTNGISISVNPTKSEYKLNEKIDVTIDTKNVGKTPILLRIENGPSSYYKMALFDANGRPVALSEHAENPIHFADGGKPTPIANPTLEKIINVRKIGEDTTPEVSPTLPPASPTQAAIQIMPERTLDEPDTVSLNDWFKIESEGTYTLVVMRRVTTWDGGFSISNATKIVITK